MIFEHCNYLGDLELNKKETTGIRLYNLPNGEWVPSITSVTSFYNRQIFINWRKRIGIEEANKIKGLLKLKKTKITLQPIEKKKMKIFSKNEYFKKYLKEKKLNINTFELADMLGSAAGNSNNIRSKFYELKNLVSLSEDENMKEFLNFLEEKFPDLLNETEFLKQGMASNRKISNIK